MSEQKTPKEEDDWDKEVDYESGKEDEETDVDDDEEMKDPIIRRAVETAKKVQMAMKAAKEAHERLPVSERPCCSGLTRIIIKDTDGCKEPISLDLSISLHNLLKCRSLYTGCCPEQLRAIHKGSPLISDKSLQSQNVKPGDTLHLILQMRGS